MVKADLKITRWKDVKVKAIITLNCAIKLLVVSTLKNYSNFTELAAVFFYFFFIGGPT